MVIAVNSHAGGNLSRTSCLYLFAFWPDIWSFHYKVVLLQVVLLQVVLPQLEVFLKVWRTCLHYLYKHMQGLNKQSRKSVSLSIN